MSKLLQQHVEIQESVDLALQESKDFKGLSEDILTKVVIETINKYQQKLNIGIQDSANDLLQTFKGKIVQSMFQKAHSWNIAKRDVFLFPRGCRFAFTKGKSTIFVIEQDPQIRSLSMISDILDETEDHLSEDPDVERIALAIPYTQFVVHFTGNQLSNVYIFWRTQPLQTLNDTLGKVLLPNIHETGGICLGASWNPGSKSFSEITHDVIGYFWNSRFNGDLSVNWWNKKRIDQRIKSARIWNENSLDDSSFIMNVNLPVHDKTLQGFIDLITANEHEPDENNLKQEISENIDSYVEGLFSKIMRYFKNTKFEKFHPKDIQESLSGVIKNANQEYGDLLFVVQNELQKMKVEIDQGKIKKIKPVSSLWSNYSA